MVSGVCPICWALCSCTPFFPNKVTHTALIRKVITVLMDCAQSDWRFAGDKGSGGARVKLDVDTIPHSNPSTNLPPVITENGEIDLGLIAFTISLGFTAFC